MPEVTNLFLCLVHRFPMKEVEEAEAVQDKGLRGCIHGRPGSKRQVSRIDLETLEKLSIPPGAVKENITTRGLDFRRLEAGQHLRIGGSLLEIALPCDPCSRNCADSGAGSVAWWRAGPFGAATGLRY